MITSKKIHQAMADNGYWEDYIEGGATASEKMYDLTLWLAVSVLSMDRSEADSDDLPDAARVVVVALAIAGALGYSIDLQEIPPVLLSSQTDVLQTTRKFINAAINKGEISEESIYEVIEDMFTLYGKLALLAAVNEIDVARMAKGRTPGIIKTAVVPNVEVQYVFNFPAE